MVTLSLCVAPETETKLSSSSGNLASAIHDAPYFNSDSPPPTFETEKARSGKKRWRNKKKKQAPRSHHAKSRAPSSTNADGRPVSGKLRRRARSISGSPPPLLASLRSKRANKSSPNLLTTEVGDDNGDENSTKTGRPRRSEAPFYTGGRFPVTGGGADGKSATTSPKSSPAPAPPKDDEEDEAKRMRRSNSMHGLRVGGTESPQGTAVQFLSSKKLFVLNVCRWRSTPSTSLTLHVFLHERMVFLILPVCDHVWRWRCLAFEDICM